MRKNSLKRIFAALALTAVATTSVTAISVSAEGEETDDTSVVDDEDTDAEGEESEAEGEESDAEGEESEGEGEESEGEGEESEGEGEESEGEGETEAPTEDETPAAPVAGPDGNGGFVYINQAGEAVTLTADDIAAGALKPSAVVETKTAEAGETVTISIATGDGAWNSTGIHVTWDADLTLVDRAWGAGVKDSDLGSKKIQDYDGGVFFTTAGDSDAGTTDFAVLTFTVPADAAKDFYPVSITYVPGDIFTSSVVDEATQRAATGYFFTQGITNGGIAIKQAETEAPTEAPTAAPTTAAPTTAAPTTTAKPAAPEAPKTGVAGAGLAVAGLVVAAGAAFVLRKKED